MTLLSKAIIYVLVFSAIVVIMALLPSTTDYPLPPQFASSITVVFGYYYAWSSVFTALNTLFICATFGIGLELVIFIYKVVTWVIGIIARIAG